MKNFLFPLVLLPFISFAQNSQEFQNELINLNRELTTKVNNAQRDYPDKAAAIQSSLQAEYAQKENTLRVKYNQIENQQRQSQQDQDNQAVIKNQQKNYHQQQYDQTVLQNMRNQQIQSQNYYQQELSNTLNSLSSSLQTMAFNQMKNELNRRLKTANNFAQFQSDKISKVESFYNQIPKSEFNKSLNGVFSAHVLSKKKYSFVNNQELVTETPALVNIENSIIKNIYLYGKEKMELDYPKTNPEKSLLSNGFAVYSDYKTLETTTILVLEPYSTSAATNYKLITNDVSYVTLWSSNKNADGKIIYIQELDKNGNII
jgi:hypothetical protein